jgi:hypothetical protein
MPSSPLGAILDLNDEQCIVVADVNLQFTANIGCGTGKAKFREGPLPVTRTTAPCRPRCDRRASSRSPIVSGTTANREVCRCGSAKARTFLTWPGGCCGILFGGRGRVPPPCPVPVDQGGRKGDGVLVGLHQLHHNVTDGEAGGRIAKDAAGTGLGFAGGMQLVAINAAMAARTVFAITRLPARPTRMSHDWKSPTDGTLSAVRRSAHRSGDQCWGAGRRTTPVKSGDVPQKQGTANDTTWCSCTVPPSGARGRWRLEPPTTRQGR